MLYARVKENGKVYAPNGVQIGKWYQVKEDYCWFGSGLRFGYRFNEFGGQFIKAEYVEVCIVGEKVNKIDLSLTEFVEVEEVYYR